MIYFIVSDVHGFYKEMRAALNDAGFNACNPDHCFVSLGDLFDRGDQAQECLDFVLSLEKDRRIFVRGNHEDLLDQAIQRGKYHEVDYGNGTVGTVMQLTKHYGEDALDEMKSNKYQLYRQELVDYAEIGNNIFVHGWIPCMDKVQRIRRQFTHTYTSIDQWRNGDWNSARWVNGMDAWNQGVRLDGKTIFCGHWHASWGHHYIEKDGMEFPNEYSTNPEHRRANFNPFVADGIVAMDACTAYTHKVNCYTLEV